jgi:hypothetical protein
MTRALVALVALALALPAPSLAQAPPTNAPPGNAAIDEYLETVPGASGDARPRQGARNDGSGLTAAERARLENAGTDGKTLADAVDATAPAPAPARTAATRERRERESANRGAGELQPGGRSPVGEVLGTFTGGDRGDGGMGIALPAILLGALLAALLLVLLRRRAAS